MGKIKLIFFTIFTLALNTIQADIQPPPCSFSFQAEWLYLRSSLQDTFFTTESVTSDFASGKNHNVDTSFHSAFRLEGGIGLPSGSDDIRVRWTQFTGSDQTVVFGPNLFSTLFFSDIIGGLVEGSAVSGLNQKLSSVEALYVYHWIFPCHFQLDVFAGAEYAFLRAHQFITYTSTATQVFIFRRSRAWGIGPEIGADLAYRLIDREKFQLSGVGRFTGSLLVYQAESSFNLGTLVTVENAREVFVAPHFYTRLGLNAGFCFFSHRINVEAGYEFNTYISALPKTLFMSGPARAITEYNTFSLQGPYIALGIDF